MVNEESAGDEYDRYIVQDSISVSHVIQIAAEPRTICRFNRIKDSANFLSGSKRQFVLRSGEETDPSSPLVAPERSSTHFLRASLVGKLVRKRLRECNIQARPYDLRHTFATQLMLAESQGLILRDYRVFFMGHKGDIENRYTTNKHSLPERVVEDMRASYARSQRFLQSEGPFRESHNLRDETYKRMLVLAGFTEEEVAEGKILELSDGQIAQKAREKLFSSVFGEDRSQKVVHLDSLEEYLAKGWRCEHVMESRGQAIVSPPTPS